MRKERQRKIREQAEALVMSVRTVLKQPEKNFWRDTGERDGFAITVERRGTSSTSSGIALGCLTAPGATSSLPGTTLEERLPPQA